MVAFLVAFEVVFLPVCAALGGNHTDLVALAFVMNEVPCAAHFLRSVNPLKRLFMSLITFSPPTPSSLLRSGGDPVSMAPDPWGGPCA